MDRIKIIEVLKFYVNYIIILFVVIDEFLNVIKENLYS